MQREGEKWEASPKTLKCGGELHSTWKKGGKGRALKKNASGKLASHEKETEVDHVAVTRPSPAEF